MKFLTHRFDKAARWIALLALMILSLGSNLMALVSVKNLTYQYPITDQPALQDINLEIEEGEFLAMVGPNGAGKSSLCYTLAGFHPPLFSRGIKQV